MASVRIRVDDFEDGVLPDVCASSGAFAARLHQTEISTKPSGWLWLLVLGGPVGLVAALVLAATLRKTVTGYLPYSDEVQGVLRGRKRRYELSLVACIALFVGALILVAADSGFGTLGVLVLVVSVLAGLGFGFLWSNTPGSVGGHLDSTARWVELAPVSARFAAAYEDQEAARKAVRQYER